MAIQYSTIVSRTSEYSTVTAAPSTVLEIATVTINSVLTEVSRSLLEAALTADDRLATRVADARLLDGGPEPPRCLDTNLFTVLHRVPGAFYNDLYAVSDYQFGINRGKPSTAIIGFLSGQQAGDEGCR
jgi:hypothetical protein